MRGSLAEGRSPLRTVGTQVFLRSEYQSLHSLRERRPPSPPLVIRLQLQRCSSLNLLYDLIRNAPVCFPPLPPLPRPRLYLYFVHTAVDTRRIPTRDRGNRKGKSPPTPALIRKSNSTSPAVLPHSSAHVFLCRNDLLLLTLIGWIKINSLHEQKGFINHAATRFCAKADVSHLFRRSAIDPENAHESSRQVKWYLLCKK